MRSGDETKKPPELISEHVDFKTPCFLEPHQYIHPSYTTICIVVMKFCVGRNRLDVSFGERER